MCIEWYVNGRCLYIPTNSIQSLSETHGLTPEYSNWFCSVEHPKETDKLRPRQCIWFYGLAWEFGCNLPRLMGFERICRKKAWCRQFGDGYQCDGIKANIDIFSLYIYKCICIYTYTYIHIIYIYIHIHIHIISSVSTLLRTHSRVYVHHPVTPWSPHDGLVEALVESLSLQLSDDQLEAWSLL